jgi:hypothetical protein
MARFVRFGILILAVAGLAACSAKASAPKSVVLDDFERVPDPGLLKSQFDPMEAIKHPTYPNHDFDVATSGYASVTSLSKDAARAARNKALYLFIQGKNAAQVRFTVPGDYRVKGSDDFPKTWETGFGLNIDSHTPLKVTDWSPYRYFDFRVYNPRPLQQTLYIRYSDADAATTITAVVLPQGECEVELPLDQLSAARLNPSDIKGVMLFLDTAGQDVDPVLMFDQLALYDTDSATRVKLALEDGEQEEDDEDWDSEDEDVVRKVLVVHPGDIPAALSATAQGLSGTAQAPSAGAQ